MNFFSSLFHKLRHAPLLVAGLVVASTFVAGITLAQTLFIPTTLDNAVITIKKIFVSDDGVTTDTTAGLVLDGASGSISALGDLMIGGKNIYLTNDEFKTSPCDQTKGCVLKISNGKVTTTSDLSPWVGSGMSGTYTATIQTGGVFQRTAGNPNNSFVATSSGTSAVMGNGSNQSFLRVGATQSSDTERPTNPDTAMVVAGSIESRGGLYIKKYNDDTKPSNTAVENLSMKLIKKYTELAITTKVGVVDFESLFEDGGNQDTVFRFSEKSGQKNTKVGINTLGTVSKTLDVVGDAAVSKSLTIGHVATFDPGTDKLAVNGSARANAYYYNSDRRYKSEIEVLNSPLENLLKLTGYRYYNKLSTKKDLGVIAQEVEAVYPELVQTDADGYKSVEYGNLVAPIIEAIKELAHKMDSLFTLYVSQQAKIDALEARLQLLEQKTSHL